MFLRLFCSHFLWQHFNKTNSWRLPVEVIASLRSWKYFMEMFTIFPPNWNWNVWTVLRRDMKRETKWWSDWPHEALSALPLLCDDPAQFCDIQLMRNAFENTKKTFHVKCFIISILTRSKFAPSQIHLLSYKK